MASAPSFAMQDAFTPPKKSSAMSISQPLEQVTPQTIELDKTFCSSEGCFVDTKLMLQNLNKLPDQIIDSCELLSIHPDYIFQENKTTLDAIKQFFQTSQVAGKVYYKKPINLQIITELYNSLGLDINTKTTYVITDIDQYPLCYGLRIKIKDSYTISIKNRKDDLISLPEIYIILQYPCQSDIFEVIQQSYTPSLSQAYYRQLQRNFLKYMSKLFRDLIQLHDTDFILYDIKLENIVYCGKQEDDFRHIDFSYGLLKYEDWIRNKPDKAFFTYVIEQVYELLDVREKISKNPRSYGEDERQSNFKLFKTILKLNDVYALLFAYGQSVDYKIVEKYNTNQRIIDLELLEYTRSRLLLDKPEHVFILHYINKLKEDLKTHMPQNTIMDKELYNLINGLVYALDHYLRGVLFGGSAKKSKIQSFINQYKNTYFISEKVNEQPYLKVIYIYRVNDILSSKNRTLSVSRYKLDLVKNPSMSLKKLKGQKEEAKLVTGSVLKLNNDRLIPL
jgi:hypothetical protein